MTDGGYAAGAANQPSYGREGAGAQAPHWPQQGAMPQGTTQPGGYQGTPPPAGGNGSTYPSNPYPQAQQPGATPSVGAMPTVTPMPMPATPASPAPVTGTPSNPSGDSPWWAQNAASDPWRNPSAEATVVQTAPPVGPPTDHGPFRPEPTPAKTGMGMIFTVVLITALLAGGLGAAVGVLSTRGGSTGTTGTGSTPPVDRPVGSVAEVVTTVMPSVVTIMIEAGDQGGNGSGFIISPDGYIITNNHVANPDGLSDVELTVVFSDGSTSQAEVVGSSEESDIAVIKVQEADLPAVTYADSDALAVGDVVLAIGAPLDLPGTVTQGIISALDRPVVAGEDASSQSITAAIQTDAAINPGNSGGPLFDGSGRVIGVNSSIATFANESGQGGNMGLGFAIPINLAKRLAEEIIADGTPTRTVIGIEPSDSTSANGVKVKTVEDPGPAATAGIKAGDVITKFNGRLITDPVELVALVRKYPGNTVVDVTFERGGVEQTVQVTLASDED